MRGITRSIRPEFWSSEDMAGLDCQIVYSGPVPERVNAVAPMSRDAGYVYFLSGSRGDLIYVGRSFRPADRFTKHRQREWWGSVATVEIIRVGESPQYPRRSGDRYESNAARIEAFAIERLKPSANIAPPLRRVVH